MSLIPRIGVLLPTRNTLLYDLPLGELLKLATFVDSLDCFDSVWVADSMSTVHRPESVTVLAAIAASTDRVTLGPACLGTFTVRHPLTLAHQWATLDAVSAGRSVLVACLGGGRANQRDELRREHNAFGLHPSDRSARLEEGIKVVRALLTGESVTFEGSHVALRDASIGAIAGRTVPIWIASNPHLFARSPAAATRSMDRVARLADGWMTAFASPGQIRVMRDQLAAAAERHARPEIGTSLVLNLSIDLDAGRARDHAREVFSAHYGQSYSDDEIDQRGIYGPPGLVLERLARYASVGVERVIAAITHTDVRHQIESLSDALLDA